MTNTTPTPDFRHKRIPMTEVRNFFNYRPTQMAALLKEPLLKVAKIGKRKFVCSESLDRLLDEKSRI